MSSCLSVTENRFSGFSTVFPTIRLTLERDLKNIVLQHLNRFALHEYVERNVRFQKSYGAVSCHNNAQHISASRFDAIEIGDVDSGRARCRSPRARMAVRHG